MTPRRVAAFALAVASIGVAIPYGTAAGGAVLHLNTLEWILSVLAFLSGLGLLSDLIPKVNPRSYAYGFAFMVAGLVWAIIAAYDAAVPGDYTIWWRLGHAIPDLAWAIVGLTAWRLVTVEARAAKEASA